MVGSDAPEVVGPAPPAWMSELRSKKPEDVMDALNRVPLFMKTLDNSDGNGGDNVELEALKALAYEGNPTEIATNFKEQGNDCYRERRYKDAIVFYTKALGARSDDSKLEEACFANRGMCNILLKNYRRAINDCTSALVINNKNVKAWFRCAKAYFMLNKLDESKECIKLGLTVDVDNKPLKDLAEEIRKKEEAIAKRQREEQEREELEKKKKDTLQLALKARQVNISHSVKAPDTQDAEIQLEDPLNPASILSYPLLFMYPINAQSDFVKAARETSTLKEQLELVLEEPPHWDVGHEYTPSGVVVYVETRAGGLAKAGLKAPFHKLVKEGNIELLDGIIRLLVVPKSKSTLFVEEWKRRKANMARS
ncbi:TPR-like protein [Ascobolus immersus RN42]|uniref:TPR-like protein n=1 Tax=Ascobolus immersus RN42 TaxID=1160509 RepID=A0A3N4I4J0_ASCIM|nr:TPR-like protein [Ascobolus immersus RN42]